MEFDIKYDADYFKIVTSGSADPETFEELFDSLVRRADWKPGTPILEDETALDASEISVEGVKMIAES